MPNYLRKIFYGPLFENKDLKGLMEFISTNELSIIESAGPIQSFEQGFTKLMGGGHSLLTQSGTAAILTSLAALGLKEGDEIIYPAFGFHACIMPARLLGLKVKFAPVREEDFLLDTDRLPEFVTEKTKAIYVLHLFGQPVEMSAIDELKKKYSFKVIADCSHALMAKYKGIEVGRFADISAFSLQQNKMLAAGEGGVVWSPEAKYIDRILALAHPGRKLGAELSSYQGISFGLKFRPHPVVAWIAGNQLKKLKAIVRDQAACAKALKDFFNDLPFSYLPVKRKEAAPAGYCYLKFRLPESLSSGQVESFRQEIIDNGKWVKPEHFQLMRELPAKPPYSFSHFDADRSMPESDSRIDDTRIEKLIRSQFGIRLPMRFEKKDFLRLYKADLSLIVRAYKKALKV